MNERGVAPVVLDDYVLLKKLGEGGMGLVYKAHQVSRRRDVAIKILRGRLATSAAERKRFEQEARLLSRLDHPGIVRALTCCQRGAYSYIVMEYVDGPTVAQAIERGPLPMDEAVRIILEVLRALDHAHQRGVLHCDVKPDNILIRSKDGAVKLTDFGLARWLRKRDRRVRNRVTCGTLQYMAPEQLSENADIDCRADLYGVGATLYHMLTACVPFAGESLAETILLKKQGVTPVREFRAEVPRQLDELVRSLLEPRPEARPQSAAEVIETLDTLDLAAEQLCVVLGKDPGEDARTDSAMTALELPAVTSAKEPTRWYLVGPEGVMELGTRHLEHLLRTGQIDLGTLAARNNPPTPFMPVGRHAPFRHLWDDLRARKVRLHEVACVPVRTGTC